MEEDNRLKTTPFSRLTVKWVPEAVNFADGTKLTSDRKHHGSYASKPYRFRNR
jgi:hypothetical protein